MSMQPTKTASLIRSAAYLMGFAVAAFFGVCIAAQFWRTDLDWIATPLSLYLFGPGGAYVQTVYDLMAAALLGFAWASYAVTQQPSEQCWRRFCLPPQG
jgi:hypothetical protein